MKNYMPLPYEYLDGLQELTDEEFGQLIRWLLEYDIFGIPPENNLSGSVKCVASLCKARLDIFNKSYDETCRKNSENGKKGGRPKTNKNSQNPAVYDKQAVSMVSEITEETDRFSETQRKNEGENERENEGENEYERKNKRNIRINEHPIQGDVYPDDFEQFWAVYPKKVGKKAALEVWKKIKPDSDLVSEMLEAIKTQKGWPQWKKDNGQYIPNPSTWLTQGRWEDEVLPKEEEMELWDTFGGIDWEKV